MKTIDPKEFRKELTNLLPGYKWVVHKERYGRAILEATGTQSAGLNRMSTMSVVKRRKSGCYEYVVKTSGRGTESPWEAERSGRTLARAVRSLQEHYEYMGDIYYHLRGALRQGRGK